MKKLIKLVFVAVLLLSFTQQSNAQTPNEEGAIDLNLGIGITSGLGFVPVYFGGNYMVNDWLSVGAQLSLRLDKTKYTYNHLVGNQKYKRTGFGIITCGDYHFNELLETPEEFDIFAGISLGVGIYGKSTYNDYVYQNSRVYFIGGVHAGAKWFFSDKFGLHLVIGGRSGDGFHGDFGVTYKLK